MSAKFIWLLLLVLDIFIGVPGQDFPCTNGAGQSGTCSTVKYCPTAAQLFASLPITKLLSDDCFLDIHGDVHFCCIPDINSTKDPVPISVKPSILVGSSITRQDCGTVINYNNPSPWFVALGQRKGNIFNTQCEGVLVSPTKVLSRATCSSRITHARIGVTLTQDITGQDKLIVNFSKLQQHQEAYSNNLGVFTLINPVKYNDRVQPICVPGASGGVDAFTIPVWEKQKNTQNGRGYSSSFVGLSVDPNSCNRDLDGNLNLQIGNICAMYKINCDSEIIGLPILTWKNPNDGKYYVLGMGAYNPNAQCDTIATYVFTRVSGYKKWIEKL